MMPLSSEDIKSYEKKKVCHTCKKGFRDDDKNTIPEILEELLIVNAI